MRIALETVRDLETLLFGLLGVAAVLYWARQPDPRRAYLAWATGLLGLVTVVGRLGQLAGLQGNLALTDVTLVVFLGSAYALLLFRHSFIPLSRGVRVLVALVLVASAISVMAVPLPASDNGKAPAHISAAQYGVAIGLILLWCACVIEPTVRFWRASRGRPRVQRGRLRALSTGFGGLVVILLVLIVVGIGGGPSSSNSEGFQLGIGVASILLAPFIASGFAPPRWLRRHWRQPEEDALRRATGALLLPTTDPAALADRALDWALRLTGADAGLVCDGDGTVLAARGMPAHAGPLPHLAEGPEIVNLDHLGGRLAIAVPLASTASPGVLLAVAGPFTPLFGTDETERLGEYALSVATALDRARLVSALREQTDRNDSMLQAMSDLGEGFVISRHGRIVYANDAYCAIIGRSQDELMAMPDLLEMVAPEDRARVAERTQRRMRGERTSDHLETAMVSADGRRIDVEVSTKVIGDPAAGQAIAIVRDVTERRRAEARFRSLLESAPDAIVGVNLDGRITLVNAPAERLFGYARDEMLGRPVEMLVPARVRALHPEHRAGYARDLRARPMGEGRSLTAVRKDGAEFPAEISLSAIDTAEGTVVAAAIRDVTEQRRAQVELERRALELQRSNAALEEFAYVASHDLQEPLRMVASYLELLSRRYAGRLDQDADDFITYAVDGAARMQALINDLLAYSRVGTRGAEMRTTEVETVVDRALANLRRVIEENGAVVTRGPLPAVEGDASQLMQLFQNLLANAVKFRGEEAPRISVSGTPTENGQVVFTVADNGIGVDPRHAERIFLIFKRLHPTSEYPGTGIGLSICRKIVERHGGRIWVEPSEGHGATFRFTLPAARSRRAGSAVPGRAAARR